MVCKCEPSAEIYVNFPRVLLFPAMADDISSRSLSRRIAKCQDSNHQDSIVQLGSGSKG